LKYRDEYSRKSGVCPDKNKSLSGECQEQDTETDTDKEKSTSYSSPEPQKECDSGVVPVLMTIPLIKKDGQFIVTQKEVDEWQETFPGIDVLNTMRHIRQWNIDNPPSRKTKRGIRKHITGWLGREQDRNGGKRQPGGRVKLQDTDVLRSVSESIQRGDGEWRIVNES
jgi:hypothetical protein